MMTIAQGLQPAMVQWQELLQRIMGDMANSPEFFKMVNAILQEGITVLSGLWEIAKDLVAGFEQGVHAVKAFRAILLFDPTTAASEILQGVEVGYKRQYEKDHPMNSGNGLRDRALAHNRGFLTSMLNAGNGGSSGLYSPTGAGGSSVSRMPAPNMPLIQSKIEMNIQQNLQHDQAVQQAVAQIRDHLFKGLKSVRDETKLLTSMIDGHAAGYGL
jgi:hypothetical protein